MKLYLFEDNPTTLDNMRDAASRNELEVISARTLQTALGLINKIKDDDIVSLDAQIPNTDDGIKIAEAIRMSGRKCLILWHSYRHSTLEVPDAERLGIYICSLPINKWINCINGCKVEWENIKDGYKYYEKQLFSHLIALSILCQGYLVAQGKKDNLHEWVNVWKNLSSGLKEGDYQLTTKSRTEGRGWWEPALGNNCHGEKLENELLDSKKCDKEIKALIAFIRENKNEMLITDTQQRENFTNLVNEAYKNLTEILKASGFNKEIASN